MEVDMEGNVVSVFFRKLLDALRFNEPRSRPETAAPGEHRKTEPFTVYPDGIAIRGRVVFPTATPSRQYPVLVICHGIPGSGAERPADDPGYEKR